MSLDEWIEGRLRGERDSYVAPNETEAEDQEAARAALDALELAICEQVYDAGVPGDRPPPQLPDDYELMAEIGRGGMGIVYRAWQKSLQREVAIKVLRPGEAQLSSWLERFHEEARHLARLRHPHIVSVHEIGQAESEPYFAMDYVAGESLDARLKRGAVTTSQAIEWALQIGEALQFAHEKGVVHLDLKPANILLDESDGAFVTDFGLAREMSDESSETKFGEVLGTPSYMAREQALGDSSRIGEATDVHGLGVVLYEMLSGASPYGQGAPAGVLSRVVAGDYTGLRRLEARVPRELETVVHKAMDPQLEQRYSTMRAFLEDLRRARDGVPVMARRPGTWRRTVSFARRERQTIGIAAGVAILTAGVVWWTIPEESPLVRTEAHVTAGEHREAVRVWSSAVTSGAALATPDLIADMKSSCLAIPDLRDAVEACLLTIELDRDLSFGRLDIEVAITLAERVRAAEIQDRPVDDGLRDLARERIGIALADPELSTMQRATAMLQAELLAMPSEAELRAPDRMIEMPEPLRPDGWSEDASIDGLLTVSADTDCSLWDRARSAFAAGWQLEGERRESEARVAYERTLGLMRQLMPIHDSTRHQGAVMLQQVAFPLGARMNMRVDPRRWMVLRASLAMQRVGGDAAGLLRPRLHLPFVVAESIAPDLPPDFGLDIDLYLIPVEGDGSPSEDAERRTATIRCGTDREGVATLGVLPGRYAIVIRQVAAAAVEAGAAHFLEFDHSILPEFVELGPSPVTLPPIRVWCRTEIELIEPGAYAEIDAETVLRWSAVPGAVHYEVVFDKTLTSIRIGSLEVRHRLEAVELHMASHPGLMEKLRRNEVDYWTVQAFDARGELIGLTVEVDETRPLRIPEQR
ncbi:MAG: serine/threonine-protein kinase [Planctomycetota bacterium]